MAFFQIFLNKGLFVQLQDVCIYNYCSQFLLQVDHLFYQCYKLFTSTEHCNWRIVISKIVKLVTKPSQSLDTSIGNPFPQFQVDPESWIMCIEYRIPLVRRAALHATLSIILMENYNRWGAAELVDRGPDLDLHPKIYQKSLIKSLKLDRKSLTHHSYS